MDEPRTRAATRTLATTRTRAATQTRAVFYLSGLELVDWELKLTVIQTGI
ncbi:hypothetical protein DY000_02040330 [Brassica cretica]|uniref:Uncharacterized protein n=1 Tax=Brassica cretica TaxID=69181 RepID=A0ABQ7B7X3_BRACR|nr:hypothetical protein DY000_02040330 [Brassica cretica]